MSIRLVLEAGPTHTGLASALGLVDVAAAAGADAVKFQWADPDRLIADKAQTYTYTKLNRAGEPETVTEPYYDLVKRRYLHHAEWAAVADYAQQHGIEFYATATYTDILDRLRLFGCGRVKIASGDVVHLPLLRQAAAMFPIVEIDTGNATLGEIERAVAVLEAGGAGIVIHHVPGGYPASPSNVHLRMIPTLLAFEHTVGFSDHSPGWDMCAAAVALGATVVEKTITLDKAGPGPEHQFSLLPTEAEAFVKAMRDLEEAMGSPARRLSPEALEARKAARRSPYVSIGQVDRRLDQAKLEWKRPQSGIDGTDFERYASWRVKALKAGSFIGLEDLRP